MQIQEYGVILLDKQEYGVILLNKQEYGVILVLLLLYRSTNHLHI